MSLGVEVLEDIPAPMLGRMYGDGTNPLPVRGDGSVAASDFNTHLEELWLEAMAECGEVAQTKAA